MGWDSCEAAALKLKPQMDQIDRETLARPMTSLHHHQLIPSHE